MTYDQLRKLPDETIMAHLVGGHGDAVAVLLDRYSRLVLSIACKIVHNQEEAEDLAQEIFLDLCRFAAQFDPAKGTTKMWIVRLAYYRSLTRRRKLNLRNSHVSTGLDDVLELATQPALELGVRLSLNEARRLVRQVLDTLDAPQRLILELVFFQGLTLRDVAEQTGATFESVRHRYYRTMEKLRLQIGEQRQGQGETEASANVQA